MVQEGVFEREGGDVLFRVLKGVNGRDGKDASEIMGDGGILEDSQVFLFPVGEEGAPSLSGEGVTTDEGVGLERQDGYLFVELEGSVKGRGGFEPDTTMFLDRMERDHVFPALGRAQRACRVPVGETVEVAMNGIGGEDTDGPGRVMGPPGVEGVLLLGGGRMGVIRPEDGRYGVYGVFWIFRCSVVSVSVSVSVRIEAVKDTGYRKEQ